MHTGYIGAPSLPLDKLRIAHSSSARLPERLRPPAYPCEMPRRMQFTQSDVHLIGVLFDQLQAKQGFLSRGTFRWLVITPAGGVPDVSIELNAGDGDENAFNLILNQSATEPGEPAYPELGERGVTTPTGWQLMADVGWVLGWRLPLDTPFDRITDFAFRASRALAGDVPDERWTARVEKRPPRPGYTNPKI